jgi:hypothetical protein
VAAERFLWLPFVTVSARSRHIQESPVLFGDYSGFQLSEHISTAKERKGQLSAAPKIFGCLS